MSSTSLFRLYVVLSAIVLSACLVSARSLLPDDDISNVHHINKRSFHNLGCLGDYDTSIFSRVDRLCEDCYNLYRDSEVRNMCREKCFTTETFERCAGALLVDADEILTMVNKLYGRD